MSVNVSYPGVYVQELPSTEKTVSGMSTSATAFVDFFARGPLMDEAQPGQAGKAVQCFSYRDFQKTFGGLHPKSEASYAISQFFTNGGETAWVIRSDDGTGGTATRQVDVTIPYLNDFANDAADAARKAARLAGRTQNIVAAMEANFAAEQARLKQPGLTPGAAAEDAAAALTNPALGTYKELAGTYGLLRTALAAAKTAIDTAETAEVDVAELRKQLNAAEVQFEQVDTRDAPDQLKTAIETSLASARTVTTAAAVAALGKAKYRADTVAQVTGVIGAAASSVTALRSIHHSTGWGTEAALAALGALTDVEKSGKDLVKTVTRLLGAAQSAVDTANDVKNAKIDDVAAVTAIRATKDALANVPEPGAEGRDDKVAEAITSAENALTTAQALPVAAEPAALAAFTNRKAAAAALGAALTEADTKVTEAQDALTAIGDVPEGAAPDTPLASAAIRASEAAVAQTEATAQTSLALLESAHGTHGWPGIALAADAAAHLTEETAEMTRDAAEATEAASKVLAERLLEWEAAHGDIAEQTKEAASDASDAAKVAEQAATSAAHQAELAARQVKINTDGDEKLTDRDGPGDAMLIITAASEAANKAAAAAGNAADRAMDAHLAAMAAGEAGAPPNLTISAISPGVWGNELRAVVLSGPNYTFDLQVREFALLNGKLAAVSSEAFVGLTLQDDNSPNYAVKVVNHQSKMARLSYKGPIVRGARPAGDGPASTAPVLALFKKLEGGKDGNPPKAAHLIPAMKNALDNLAPQVFNLLCLPITGTYAASEAGVAIEQALGYCEEKRAFMIVDIPESVRSVDQMQKWAGKHVNAVNYCGAVYFPRLVMPDPLQGYRDKNVGPSGTLAGIYARTDSRRGVWKAPAGTEASIVGANVAMKMTDEQDGLLNPRGVNCLRSFPVYGNISWGARTLAGADLLQSQWKYINVRRLTSYIEESLYQNLKWAVFEGNDERLWNTIKQQVGKFLSGLFVDGAFAGGSPGDAYFVECDKSTTSADDVARGIVNVLIGIAPIKPAEFIILQIQQIAGQD